MKGFGKVPTNIADWHKFRRLVFKTVGAACGTPQMGTDMLLAAESHQGPPDKIKTYDAWEKINAHLAIHLPDAIHDLDMIRESTALHDRFLKKHRKGSLLGNILIRRYLTDSPKLAQAISREGMQDVQQFQEIFEKYGSQYGYDWLQIAAQAYQESELNPDAKNRSGATGLMQIRPATARDKNVGIHDISQPKSNVHAGVKYMRFLADRYFNDEEMHPMDQWMFTLAAYNAGPARVQKLRREAHKRGLDQNRWIDNVETVTSHRVGSETVRYVTDIAKYFLGYKLAFERHLALQELRARQNADRAQGAP